jgi:hypothetical protein
LAIAEILFKQTGASSLDAARAQHRHHGLLLRVTNTPQDTDLETASAALIAEPLIRANGDRFGTFELWHRSCREMPLCCNVSSTQAGGEVIGFRAVLVAQDKRLPMLPKNGISLLECLRMSPGMIDFLPSFGIIPDLVRGTLVFRETVQTVQPPDLRSLLTIVIHPGEVKLIHCFFHNVLVRPDEVERMNFQERPHGGIITHSTNQDTTPGGMIIPNGSTWRKSEIRLWPTPQPLNEFGYLYVGLYILGNYARYFPDRWLRDVEQNSPLALAVEELVYIAEQRMAMLAYNELTRVYHVIDD